MSRSVRYFIRESLRAEKKEESLNENLLLALLGQIIKNKYFTEDDEDPCVDFKRLLDTEEMEGTASVLAGIGLAFVPVSLGASLAVRSLSAGVVAFRAGRILATLGNLGIAGFFSYGGYVTVDQVFTLYKYATMSATDLGISEFERNRICSELLGQLFMSMCLSSILGRTVKGSEIKNFIMSPKQREDFKNLIAKGFGPFVSDSAKSALSIMVGTNFVNIYESKALSKLRTLQPEKLYTINPDVAVSMMTVLDEKIDSATFTTAEIARGVLVAKLQEICASGYSPAEKRKEARDAYEELKKILEA